MQVIRDSDGTKIDKMNVLINNMNTMTSLMETDQLELKGGMFFTVIKSKSPESELIEYYKWLIWNQNKDCLSAHGIWLEGFINKRVSGRNKRNLINF